MRHFPHALPFSLPLLVVGLALAPAAQAAASQADDSSSQWQTIGPPGQAAVDSVAFDPQRPEVAFATMNGGGIARSVDAGLTWQTSSAGLSDPNVYGLVVHPQLSQLVYATNDAGQLVRSLDGGKSWSELPVPGGLDVFAPVAVDPALIYVGTDAGLFLSRDQGDTWRRVEGGGLPPFYSVQALAVDAKDPRLLYAGIRHSRGFGLWVSQDAGRSWSRRLHGVPDQLFVDPQRSGTVYLLKRGYLQRSRDQGATWEVYFDVTATGSFDGVAVGLVFDPHHARIAYVLSYDGPDYQTEPALYKTTDDGSHWQALSAGLPGSFFPNSLAASPAGPLLLGSSDGSASGLYRSDDGGASWGAAGAVLVNTTVVALAFGARGTIFAATGDSASTSFSVARTRDDGATWYQVLQLPAPPTALAIDPSNPDTLYVGALGAGYDPQVLWKSSDGGDTWAPLPYPQALSSGIGVTDIAVAPFDSQVVYLAAHGLYRSGDGGQTWEETSLPTTDFVSVALAPAQRGTVWAVGQNGVYKSTDAGQTWSELLSSELNFTYLAVEPAPSDPNVVWVVGQSFIYRTPDAGATWQRYPGLLGPNYFAFSSFRPLAVDPSDPSSIFLAWFGGVSRFSVGSRFQQDNNALFNRDAICILFNPANSRRLVVGTRGAGAFEVRVDH